MNDNPYKESMERERERVQNAKPMGRMFLVGCLLLALREFVEAFVRYKSTDLPYILLAPVGIKPSDIMKHYQFVSWVSAAASGISLVGGGFVAVRDLEAFGRSGY